MMSDVIQLYMLKFPLCTKKKPTERVVGVSIPKPANCNSNPIYDGKNRPIGNTEMGSAVFG